MERMERKYLDIKLELWNQLEFGKNLNQIYEILRMSPCLGEVVLVKHISVIYEILNTNSIIVTIITISIPLYLSLK